MKTQNLTDLSRTERKKKKYPYLGRYSSLARENEMLVLFSGVKEGTVIHENNSFWNIGDHSVHFNEGSFEEVTAVIEFVKED